MGHITELGFFETEAAEYRIDRWRGHGYTTRSDKHGRPAILYRKDGDKWNKLDEWSSTENSIRKSDVQLFVEAIKHMRFYDETDITDIDVVEFLNGTPTGTVYIVQPSIEHNNSKWMVYRLGATKVTGTFYLREEAIERVKEIGSCLLVVVDGEGQLRDHEYIE